MSAVLGAGLLAGAGAPTATSARETAGSKVIGRFTGWDTHAHGYRVESIGTPGSADGLIRVTEEARPATGSSVTAR